MAFFFSCCDLSVAPPSSCANRNLRELRSTYFVAYTHANVSLCFHSWVSCTPTICEYIILFSVCVSGFLCVCARTCISPHGGSLVVALLWPHCPLSNPSANETCAVLKGVVWGSAAGQCLRIRGPDRRSRGYKRWRRGVKKRLDRKKKEGYCQQFSRPKVIADKCLVTFVLFISA